MAQYMFLLYDSPQDFQDYSPEQMQGVIAKYSAWNDKLVAEGKLAGGQKLADGEGRVLRGGSEGFRVLDGPYSETKEVIGGYFVIEADSYDEATEIARTCPHLEFEGSIEVRRVDEV